MALTPSAPLTPADKRAQRDAAEQEVHLREVDEAVRQADFEEFMAKWGRKILFAVIALLAAFGGYLFWQSRQEAAKEQDSEALVSAIDQLGAGNLAASGTRLAPLADEGGEGASAAARMLRAGIAQQQGRREDAARLFAAVAADENTAAEMRELARLRELTLRYDGMDKAALVAALKPLAVPGKPFFGSAGELLAHAYLDQGKRAEAGALFAQIAKDRQVPQTLRARSRQMAGLLGVDAIENTETAIAEETGVAAGGAAPGQ